MDEKIEDLRAEINVAAELLRVHGGRVGLYLGRETPEHMANEIEKLRAELAALKAEPTPWELLNYAQKQQREAAMQRVAGSAGHGAHVTTDFPWQGRVTVAGSWTIDELRRLLAAMEGR